jgi:ABC transporter substrate binding protein
MRRRDFITLLGGALTSRPFSANAQPAAGVPTVGMLMGLADDAEARSRSMAFEQGLEREGWSLGQNLRIEYRYAKGDPARMQAFAKELVELKPDCIVGHSTPVVKALKHATRTIPIVFVMVSDPIGSGFVASMARPGGNITGFTILQKSIAGKYLSMLKEMLPQLAHVALMYNPKTVPDSGTFFSGAFMEAAAQYKVRPIIAQVHDPPRLKIRSGNSAVKREAASFWCRITSRPSIVSSSFRSPRSFAFRQFTPMTILPRPAGSCPTGWMPRTCSGAHRSTSAASFVVPTRRIFQCKRRRNSSL